MKTSRQYDVRKLENLQAAILIVAVADDRWVSLCLDQFSKFTTIAYKIFLCSPIDLSEYETENVRFLQYPDSAVRHFDGLQYAFNVARGHNPEFIITADIDSFPVADSWDKDLVQRLNEGYLLGGIYRNELSKIIQPYIHPSCLCIRLKTIEELKLRFDIDNYANYKETGGAAEDTLSHFSRIIDGSKQYRWFRSNRYNYHRLIAGVYNNMFYHHGATSRLQAGIRISLHDAQVFHETSDYLEHLTMLAADDLFENPRSYFDRLMFG